MLFKGYKGIISKALLLFCSILSLYSLLYADTQQTTLNPSADTYVRSGANDTNEGGSVFLRVRSSGRNKGFVAFDQNAIAQAIGNGTLISAILRLHITDNADNWGSLGRTVDAHRMRQNWAEGNGSVANTSPSDRGTGAGATYRCAIDSDISNQAKDCPPDEWNVKTGADPSEKPWEETVTDSVLITNGLTGSIDYDVTTDVQAYLDATATNYGWVIKKTEEGQNGRIEFSSKEGSQAAELILTYNVSAGDTTPPVVIITTPPDQTLTNSPTITVTGTVDEDVTSVTVNGNAASFQPGQSTAVEFTATNVALSEGANTILVVATDLAGNQGSTSITVTLDTIPPQITIDSPLDGAELTTTPIVVSGTVNEPVTSVTVNAQSANVNGLAYTYSLDLQEGANPITVAATDLAGNTSQLSISVTYTDPNAGDPNAVAPVIDKTVSTVVGVSTAFLYEGANPIQQGVAPGTIETKRASVLRGYVQERDGTPLEGVTVTIANHPELGFVTSRADGAFDIAVNGGGRITVAFDKDGYLPAHRSIRVKWQEFTWIEDPVALIELDTAVTAIDLTSATAQVAQGNVVTDIDGSRQATVFFPTGTTAQLVFPNGSTQAISNLSVRATEYTVGPNGKNAMPASLPRTSAYTYAVELSADEVALAGATDVEFSQPLSFYLENFLQFPVGEVVPTGYYSFAEEQWLASENGKIIEIVAINAGVADVDYTGDGVADDPTVLGLTLEERTELGSLYTVGETLWRVPITHFTPWDCNWAWGLPAGALPPENPILASDDEANGCPSCDPADFDVDLQHQIQRERIPIPGTPYNMTYGSDRVQGRKASRTITIPLSGGSPPSPLSRVDLQIQVAGQLHQHSFTGAPNQNYTFEWDGKDAYGRNVQGTVDAQIKIGYVYQGEYRATRDVKLAFATLSRDLIPIGINRQSLEVTLWQEYEKELTVLDYRHAGLGGWSIDAVDFYDINSQSIHMGDGGLRKSAFEPLEPSGVTDAANFSQFDGYLCNQYAPGAKAEETCILRPFGIAYGPDGSRYVTSLFERKIYKITPDGDLIHFAGAGVINGPLGNGGPALQANFSDRLADIEVGDDGSVYVVDMGNYAVRKIDANGIITNFAGNGQNGYLNTCPQAADLTGDGGPATQAKLAWPNGTIDTGLKFGPDGALYVSQAFAIRKITADGNISTPIGVGEANQSGGCSNFNHDFEGPAHYVKMICPGGMDFDDAGNMYFAERCTGRVRKVDPSGNSTNFAGDGFDNGDVGQIVPLNVAATSVGLGQITDVEVGDLGEVYISKRRGIVVVDAEGIVRNHTDLLYEVTRMARNPVGVQSSNNGEALNYTALVSTFDPSHTFNPEMRGQVLSRRPVGPDFSDVAFSIASEGGALLHGFDNLGRHRTVKSTLTGEILTEFRYNSAGRLNELEDGDGNITTITWSDLTETAYPVSIQGPYGHLTLFGVNADGYIDTVTNPESETYLATYHDAEGLLASFTRPNGQVSQFTYNPLGFLSFNQNDVNGSLTLTRSYPTAERDIWSVVAQTAEGRQSTYSTTFNDKVDISFDNTFEDGSSAQASLLKSGQEDITTSEGVLISSTKAPDPRFGFQAPLTGSYLEQNPGGATMTLAESESVTLNDQFDPLSLTSLSNTLTDNGRQYTYSYDPVSKTETRTSPEGRTSTSILDGQTRPISIQVPNISPVTLSYDVRGRLDTMVTGSGADTRTYTYAYGTDGFLESVTDTLNRVTSFERDGIGRITKQILPDLREINITYDANGNISTLTPPGRPAHVFRYTALDESREYEPPALAGILDPKTVYTYTLDRDLDTVLRPDGKLLDFNYNNKHQLTSLVVPRGTFTFSYDAVTGQRTTAVDPGGVTLSYAYDGDLLSSTTWSGAVTGSVSQTYNNSFYLDTMSVNGAHTVSFSYDQDDLLTGVGSLSIGRDPANGLVTGTTLGAFSTSNSYNAFGEPQTITFNDGTNDVFSTSYTYDTIGRIITKAETVQGVLTTYEYIYDTAGRLDQVKENSVVVRDYDYDLNSARTHVNGVLVGVYDDQDRLLSYDGTTYSYNDNGDLTTKVAGPSTTTYNYDVFGNLLGAVLPNGDSIEYLIDAGDRRVGKKVNGVVQYFLLYGDALNPVAELDASGAVVSRFVYGSRSTVPDYIEKGGVTYRVVADHLGSVRLVVDVATGVVAQRIDYDEFGRVLSDSNPGFQPFGFAGGLYDADTGLVRFGARDYDAEIGRWTSKDPILFNGGDTNLYGYVVSDPVNLVDPWGEDAYDKLAEYWQRGKKVVKKAKRHVGEAVRGVNDMANYYHKMKKDNYVGSDKYYHCIANCKAASRGPGGDLASCLISAGREASDIPKNKFRGEENDTMEDMVANDVGRGGGRRGVSCSNTCERFRPDYVPKLID